MNYLGFILLTPLVWGFSYGIASVMFEGLDINTFGRKAIFGLIISSAYWGIITFLH